MPLQYTELRVNNWVETVKHSLYLVGCSMFVKPEVNGLQRPKQLKDRHLWKIVEKEVLFGRIVKQPQPWRFWIMVVYENEQDGLWYDEVFVEPKDTITSMQNGTMLRDLIKSNIAEEFSGDVIGYGYVCCCSPEFTLEKVANVVKRSLIANGLFDKTKHRKNSFDWKEIMEPAGE